MVIVSLGLIISSIYLEYQHESEIERIINEKGGEVTKIEEINRESSPFSEESSKYNIIYKVYYQKNGESFIAWYRGVQTVNNIHDQTPSPYGGGYSEKWLFE